MKRDRAGLLAKMSGIAALSSDIHAAASSITNAVGDPSADVEGQINAFHSMLQPKASEFIAAADEFDRQFGEGASFTKRDFLDGLAEAARDLLDEITRLREKEDRMDYMVNNIYWRRWQEMTASIPDWAADARRELESSQ